MVEKAYKHLLEDVEVVNFLLDQCCHSKWEKVESGQILAISKHNVN